MIIMMMTTIDCASTLDVVGIFGTCLSVRNCVVGLIPPVVGVVGVRSSKCLKAYFCPTVF